VTLAAFYGGPDDGKFIEVPDSLPYEFIRPSGLPPMARIMEKEIPVAEFPVIRYRLEWLARIYVDDDGNEIGRFKWPVYMHPDINKKAMT
jgi:hypothetical protein